MSWWGPSRLPWFILETQWGREVWLASSLFPLPILSPLYPSPVHDVTPASFRVTGGEGGEIQVQKKCWWCLLGGSQMPRCWLFLSWAAQHWRHHLRVHHPLIRVTQPQVNSVTCLYLPCRWGSQQTLVARFTLAPQSAPGNSGHAPLKPPCQT